ncbi:MAG TPA: TadE/TadG family type IV pilus assembly protein [Azospirillum sp.]|nr:TadE/TadG family type IV pilus assembly protein [Azospirillum sp.]
MIPAIIRRALAGRRGSTALEFGLLAPVLILLAVAFFEYGVRLAIQASLDFAAREASRVGITGAPPPAGTTREAQLVSVARQAVMPYVDASKVDVRMLAYDSPGDIGKPEPFTDLNGNGRWDRGEPFTDVNGNGVWDVDRGRSGAGASAQVAVYRLSYAGTPLSGLFPAASYEARIVVRNEPFAK